MIIHIGQRYQVCQGSGLDSGRVGTVCSSAGLTQEEFRVIEPGRYTNFDPLTESLLVDDSMSWFTMFKSRLEECEAMAPMNQSSTIADILEVAASNIKWAIAIFPEELVSTAGKIYGKDLLLAVNESRADVNDIGNKFFIIDNCGCIYEVSTRQVHIGDIE